MIRKDTAKKVSDAYRLLKKQGIVMSVPTSRGFTDLTTAKEAVVYANSLEIFESKYVV